MGRLAHALPPPRAAQRRKADRNITSAGGSADDVTQSKATGAAVEPVRALQRVSAVRHRAWRVTGVTIWLAPHRVQRPASRSVRQAGLVHAQREGNKVRDPWARERAAVLRPPARPAWPCCVRDGCPAGARRWAIDSSSTRNATARPRAAGSRPCHLYARLQPKAPRRSRVRSLHRCLALTQVCPNWHNGLDVEANS